MRERPFAPLSAYERDVMMILTSGPMNGMDVRSDLQDAHDLPIDPRSVCRVLGGLAEDGLVDVEDQGTENRYRLSDDGRELVDRDLDWLADR